MADQQREFTDAMKEFRASIKQFSEASQQQRLGQIGSPALAALAGAGGEGGAGGGAFGKWANKAGGGVESAVSLAGGGVLSTFAELGGKLSQFVEALNPSAMLVFNAAMKDLSAVVGTAVMPIFEALTQGVKEAANLLLPVAEELAPVFGQMAQTMLSVLQPILQLMANQVKALVPLLQIFADVMQGLAPLLQAWYTVQAALFGALADFLASLLGGNYKDAMQNFQTAMQKLASAALVAVAGIAKWMDGLGIKAGGLILDNLIKAVKGGAQQDATGLGAATAGQVTSIASFEQSELAKAFTSSSLGDQQMSQTEWLKQQAETLEGIRDGQINAMDKVKELLLEASRFIVKGIVSGLGGTVNEALAPSPQTAADAAALAQAAGQGGWIGALTEYLRRRA
jgi:hypothetical protein